MIVTAPDPLRTHLRGLNTRELITHCATRRPDRTAAADPTVAAVLTLRALARRHQHLCAEITELDALIGPNKWWALGLGYDHAFAGRTRVNGTGGAFTDLSWSLDELWALGRVYPWQNDNVALYLQLGLGPTWQSVNLSGDIASPSGVTGNIPLMPTQCSGHGAMGLGLRGGAGVDVVLSSLIIFYGEVGVDHFRTTSDSVGALEMIRRASLQTVE